MSTSMIRKVMKCKAVLAALMTCCILVCFTGATAAKKPKLSRKTVTLKVGKSVKIKVLNINKNTKIKWSVNDDKIAIVKKGKITAKKEGTTKVIAKVGQKKLVCKVNVIPASKEAVSTAAPDVEGNEEGMYSGSKKDFYKYFDIDSSKYTKRQKGVAAGDIKKITYDSSVVGTAREAYVYTPAGYQQDIKYPVVYMLHGIGCDGGQWVSMNIAEVLDNMIARQEIKPVIAVFPGIIPKDGINKETLSQENIHAFNIFIDEFTQDLEPYILGNYSVSPDREDTGVCGLSMGGMEALELGFSLQNRFNYIGSFSAAPSLNTSVLHYTDENTIPQLVLLCNGTKDTTVGDNPLNYHKELTRNGVKHIWYQYPDGGHSTPVWINGAINFLSRSYYCDETEK